MVKREYLFTAILGAKHIPTEPQRLFQERNASSKRLAFLFIVIGGDGGESNSPSRRGCPEYATGLVSFLILPG